MEKSITTFKDLVFQTLTNSSELKTNAEKGDALYYFQMGMIHLLGVDTPIDFKKAGQYFGNQNLINDSNANRLLGFIAECEGFISKSFNSYAEAGRLDGKGKRSDFITDVINERNIQKESFVRLDLPTSAFNKGVSAILDDYTKGGESKINACVKIANIYKGGPTCLEVAKSFMAVGDYYSAKKWLLKGYMDNCNDFLVTVDKKFEEIESTIKSADEEVVEVSGNSLLEDVKLAIDNGENDNLSTSVGESLNEWKKNVTPIIESLKKAAEEEERMHALSLKEKAEREKIVIDETQRKGEEKEIITKEEPANQINQNKVKPSSLNCPKGVIENLWADNTIILPNNYNVICIHASVLLNGMKGGRVNLKFNFKHKIVDKVLSGTYTGKKFPTKIESDHVIWEDEIIIVKDAHFARSLNMSKDGRYYLETNVSLYDHLDNVLDSRTIPVVIDFVHHMFKSDEFKVVK